MYAEFGSNSESLLMPELRVRSGAAPGPVRLRLVSVHLASCHFSIDLTVSVAQKRLRTVIDRVLQASYWTQWYSHDSGVTLRFQKMVRNFSP